MLVYENLPFKVFKIDFMLKLFDCYYGQIYDYKKFTFS